MSSVETGVSNGLIWPGLPTLLRRRERHLGLGALRRKATRSFEFGTPSMADDSLLVRDIFVAMTAEARTFLTFQGGDGNAALELYESVFDDFSLISIQRFGEQDAAPPGTIKHATFRLAGHELACSDSAIEHDWGFTPAISLYVECDDEPEQQRIFNLLSDDGQVYMPLDAYGFSTRFGWVGDRFGVTWQLNLA